MTSESQGDTTFASLSLHPQLLEGVAEQGFTSATPIQAATIPPLLEGRDLIGRARTGSGKTAAFGLPLLHLLAETESEKPLGIILAPTRELALQVSNALKAFAQHLPNIKIATVYGGAPYPPQIKALKRGANLVVGTPGRVIDLLEKGHLDLNQVQHFVLDEADEMLRMGFIEPVNLLLDSCPDERQVVLFSATMPNAIQKIAEAKMANPLEIQVESSELSVDHIDQYQLQVPHRKKLEALTRLLQNENTDTVLIFCRTRAACADVADALVGRGVAADALHGDLNQGARERVLQRLRARRLSLVVATDVAARGIDVQHISHVINFDFPTDDETYVHRIGRTGRAGRAGTAISFITPKERFALRRLEKKLKIKLKKMTIPSDADIAIAQRTRLVHTLLNAPTTEELEQTRVWLTEIAEKHDVETTDIAAALLALYSRAQDTPLVVPEQVEIPDEGDSDRPRREKRHHDDSNKVELFFPVGKVQGIRPGDLVGALANEAGISGDDIGRITLTRHKSFVAVEPEIAQRILDKLSFITLHGHDIPVRLAFARSESAFDRDRRPSRRFKRERFDRGPGDRRRNDKFRGERRGRPPGRNFKKPRR